MFKNKNNDDFMYQQIKIQRLLYELDEINRKLKNLNNRLRRVEGFLGLIKDDDKNT